MLFSNKNKALIITILITGTLVLSMFNFHVLKLKDQSTEIFYEIEPEQKSITEQQLEQQKNTSKSETNKAFNENKKSQRYAQRLKRIAPPQDYVRPHLDPFKNVINSNNSKPEKTSEIDKEELQSFSKVNELLKKQLEEAKEDANNSKSTVSYSLVDRKHRYLPIPIYLCEASGKITVNITVNASGKVTDAYYNTASNSSNECLIESALEYAKKARFNSKSSKKSQLGSITFYFEGKH